MFTMVKFKSNRRQVLSSLDSAKKNMLTAVGMAGSSHVKQTIQSKDLIDTGALLASIDHAEEEDAVYVGSTLADEVYPIVLEKNGNEYLHPGIMNNLNNLRSVAERNFKL